jgi:hypothetical protein
MDNEDQFMIVREDTVNTGGIRGSITLAELLAILDARYELQA